MFGGKSSELLRRMRRDRVAGKSVLLVTHSSDTRYDDAESTTAVNTHDGVRSSALRVSCIKDGLPQMQAVDSVFVDELQFFPDLHNLEHVETVTAAGLLHQHIGAAFPNVLASMHLWHDIVFLHAVCSRCGSQYASRTKRTMPIGESMVGGAESYTALCAKCFID